MLRFVLVFIFVLVGMFALELTPLGQTVVVPWTAMLTWFSAALIAPFDVSVIYYGHTLQNQTNGFGVSIEAGCNGVEACIVLVGAMLAFPAPWRHKLLGVVIGVVVVQAVNILRIISLFYLGQWRMDAFEFAHLYLWQGLIMLDVLVVWLIWIRAMPEKSVVQQVA